MISRKLVTGFVSVAALALSGTSATAPASAGTVTHLLDGAVRPAVDESQGCTYTVNANNIHLYSFAGGGTRDANVGIGDTMVSAPLLETGSSGTDWEYVMDTDNFTGTIWASGWIEKKYMDFGICTGPRYNDLRTRPAAVRPALDESQGCVYEVKDNNIYLYATDTGGKSIAETSYDDIVVSAPLDETGSGTTGWEYVMDVQNTRHWISGWIQKQYMEFLNTCTGPMYGD